jgi:hypothetical protein
LNKCCIVLINKLALKSDMAGDAFVDIADFLGPRLSRLSEKSRSTISDWMADATHLRKDFAEQIILNLRKTPEGPDLNPCCSQLLDKLILSGREGCLPYVIGEVLGQDVGFLSKTAKRKILRFHRELSPHMRQDNYDKIVAACQN